MTGGFLSLSKPKAKTISSQSGSYHRRRRRRGVGSGRRRWLRWDPHRHQAAEQQPGWATGEETRMCLANIRLHQTNGDVRPLLKGARSLRCPCNLPTTDTYIQTDRQTDRQTHTRIADRQTDNRQTHRLTHTQFKHRRTDRQTLSHGPPPHARLREAGRCRRGSGRWDQTVP